MTFRDRFKMYLLGFIAGCFLVVLFFGRRNSCKNYIPNYLPQGRVIQEIQSHPIVFTDNAMSEFQNLGLDTADFRAKLLPELDVDFDLSDQRQKPCGQYVTFYKDSLLDLRIDLEKCMENSRILKVSSLK